MFLSRILIRPYSDEYLPHALSKMTETQTPNEGQKKDLIPDAIEAIRLYATSKALEEADMNRNFFTSSADQLQTHTRARGIPDSQRFSESFSTCPITPRMTSLPKYRPSQRGKVSFANAACRFELGSQAKRRVLAILVLVILDDIDAAQTVFNQYQTDPSHSALEELKKLLNPTTITINGSLSVFKFTSLSALIVVCEQ